MLTIRRLWGRVRRVDPRLADGVVVAILLAASAAQLLAGGLGQAVHLPAVAGATLPLLWRRRYPLASCGVQVVSALLTLQAPPIATQVALFLGMYSASAYSRRPLLALVPPLGLAAVLAILPTTYPYLPAWALVLIIGVGLWLAGSAVRERQRRLRRLEHERELAARVAVADERARLARELHDVIAHSVSVMVVQAGAARRLLDRQPERSGEAMREVEHSGREALTELRRLLGVLAERPDEAVLAPQPGLGQLGALVERVDASGVTVDLRVVGTPRPLPPGLDLTAYRVVQEALTNVLKHAAGARTEVLVEYGADDLRLAVVDGGGTSPAAPSSGGGRGLLGMRERVAAYGGDVEAAALPSGGFAVRARLPLEPA